MDFDTTEQKPLNITTRTPDGTETRHTFEILPLTKNRYDKVIKFTREMTKAEKKPGADAGQMMADFCDALTKSTNGPVTFQSMWEADELPLAWLKRISEALVQEVVGNPPA